MSGHCFKLAPSLGLGTAELVVDGSVRSFDWSVFAYGRFARRGDPRRRRARAGMIGGVLLAAGAGTRFRAAGGGVKLLAPVAGRPLVERALAALAAAGLGDRVSCSARRPTRYWRRDRPARRAPGAQRALGARHGLVAAGRSRGARPGLQRRRSSCSATVRRSAAEAIRRVAAAAEGAVGVVAATYGGGRGGHPVAIPRALWAQLPREGEQGARALGEPAVLVDCSDLPAPGDADTPADLA